MFKYPKLFRLDNGSKFKSDVTRLMFEEQQKHANTHTHTHIQLRENPLTKS